MEIQPPFRLIPRWTRLLVDVLIVCYYNKIIHTVIETPEFQKQAEKIRAQKERHAFIDWIAQNPLSGDVIPGADGARKVRWSVTGKGKRCGVRVIYFNLSANDVVLLIAVYAKAHQSNIATSDIKKA